MLNYVLGGSALLLVAGVGVLHAKPRPPMQSARIPVASAAMFRGGLDRDCVSCHNDRLQSAGLSLEMTNLDQVGVHAEIWEKVLTMLRTQEMPPPAQLR